MPLSHSPKSCPVKSASAISGESMSLDDAATDLDQLDEAVRSEMLDVSTPPNPAKRQHTHSSPVVELHVLEELLSKSGEDARKLAASSAAAASVLHMQGAEEARRMHEQVMGQMRADRDAQDGRLNHLDEKVDRAAICIDRNSDAIERAARSLDLTIRGVPASGNETPDALRALLVRLGDVLKVPLDNERLMHVFRVKPRAGTQSDHLIIARFGSVGVRHAFYNAYFARKTLGTRDLGFAVDQRIYVSENLTRNNSILRGKATALKKAGQIINFSTRDGIVRIIAREGNRPRPVFNDAELEECVLNGPRSGKRPRGSETSGPAAGGAFASGSSRPMGLVPAGPSSGPSALAGGLRKLVIEGGQHPHQH